LTSRVKQAVVLAGGEGTRLRPLTNARPKPLLPVLGRPCVEYVLRSLASAGIEEVFLTCSYRSNDMVAALGEGREFGIDLIYAFEEQPAGTAGAVKLLEERLGPTFVVASGDVLADVDIGTLIEFHRRKGAWATIALTEVESPQEFGIVGLDDDGRIVRFKEKPAVHEVFSNLINAGVYVLEKEAVAHIPFGEKFDFSKNLFPRLLEAGKPLFGTRIGGLWKDIGRSSDLLEANLRMADRRGKEVAVPGATVVGKVSGGGYAAEGAAINGPAHIGEGARLEKGSVVTSSVIGRGSVVGMDAEVIGSLLMDRCSLGIGCSVRESVLGEGCGIGPGVQVVNSVLGDGVRLEGPLSLEGKTLE